MLVDTYDVLKSGIPNAIRCAHEVLEPMGVKINDLYGVVAEDIPAYIDANDFIHLTPPAAKLCAEKVADAIKAVI